MEGHKAVVLEEALSIMEEWKKCTGLSIKTDLSTMRGMVVVPKKQVEWLRKEMPLMEIYMKEEDE